MVLVGRSSNNIYLKELIFDTHLTNDVLAEKIKATGHGALQMVADSAEPKSIAELGGLGLNVAKALKGPDSVRAGIMLVREFDLHVDPGSVNLLKEIRAYKWSDKKSGVPVKAYDHGMDAMRYVVSKFMRRGGGFSLGPTTNLYDPKI